jgi:hypothetical protein
MCCAKTARLTALLLFGLTTQVLLGVTPGRVLAWGSGLSSPTNVPAGLSNVIAVSAGGTTDGSTSLALKTDGKVVAWERPIHPLRGDSSMIP